MLSRVKGAKVHTPFEAGQCSLCHLPHATDTRNLLTAEGSGLCLVCHGNILEGGKAIKSTHLPVKQDCTSCHDPHGSVIKAQLKQKPKDLCLNCHVTLSEKMKKPDARVHPPIVDGDCGLCHKPHESQQPKLLQASLGELCATCHEVEAPKFVKAHGEIQVKGTACTECHDPHAAEGPGLFHPVVHKPFAGRVCTACHKKE
jgi:predicted CXXCH cytochrome family protein